MIGDTNRVGGEDRWRGAADSSIVVYMAVVVGAGLLVPIVVGWATLELFRRAVGR